MKPAVNWRCCQLFSFQDTHLKCCNMRPPDNLPHRPRAKDCQGNPLGFSRSATFESRETERTLSRIEEDRRHGQLLKAVTERVVEVYSTCSSESTGCRISDVELHWVCFRSQGSGEFTYSLGSSSSCSYDDCFLLSHVADGEIRRASSLVSACLSQPRNPKRTLTWPCEGVHNSGLDNAEHNYICHSDVQKLCFPVL